MPTARNARGIDIIAYNENGTKFIGVQVKTVSKRDPIGLGTNLEKVMGDYWLIVNNVAEEPNIFVLLPNEVKSLAVQDKKGGRYWLQPKAYDVSEFKEAWHKIDVGNLAH